MHTEESSSRFVNQRHFGRQLQNKPVLHFSVVCYSLRIFFFSGSPFVLYSSKLVTYGPRSRDYEVVWMIIHICAVINCSLTLSIQSGSHTIFVVLRATASLRTC
ncbi:hypothetical protein AHF37_11803 [Paragonimus kellicotti]|nr:hypothetical protein AHF37_11803 [Paragonimus kellicotti]